MLLRDFFSFSSKKKTPPLLLYNNTPNSLGNVRLLCSPSEKLLPHHPSPTLGLRLYNRVGFGSSAVVTIKPWLSIELVLLVLPQSYQQLSNNTATELGFLFFWLCLLYYPKRSRGSSHLKRRLFFFYFILRLFGVTKSFKSNVSFVQGITRISTEIEDVEPLSSDHMCNRLHRRGKSTYYFELYLVSPLSFWTDRFHVVKKA